MDNERIEWLKSRKSCIGGSDISAIMGYSAFKNSIDVYYDKIDPNDITDTPSVASRRGQALEPLVAEIFEEKEACELVHHPYYIWRDKRYDFIGCTVDRLVSYPWMDNAETVLEIKTAVGKNAEWDIDIDSGEYMIPNAYYCQTMWNYGIVRQYLKKPLDYCILAALLDDKYHKFELKFDEVLFNNMVEVAKNMWLNHIIPQIVPDNVDIDSTVNLYRSSVPGKITVADSNLFDMIKEMSALQSQQNQLSNDFKYIDDRIEQIKANIKELITDSEVLLYNDVPIITYKSTNDSVVFDADRFMQEQPLVYKQYIKVKKGSRRFLVKNKEINNLVSMNL
jgi:putative phage-type endonuclease